MLSWKDSWPFGSSSSLRQNRYYFKDAAAGSVSCAATNMERLLSCLSYTFGLAENVNATQCYVHDAVDAFAKIHGDWRAQADSFSVDSPVRDKGILPR